MILGFLFFSTFVFLILRSLLITENPIPDDGIPLANPPFRFEPRYLVKLKWLFFSRQILNSAYDKFKGTIYRVDRGDRDVVVLPTELIPELNLLPKEALSSRVAHAYNLAGVHSRVNIVTSTNLHGETIQHRITPNLPKFVEPMKKRVGWGIDAVFPKGSDSWKTEPIMHHCIHVVSRIIAFVGIGAPICDDPEYIRLTSMHARHVFTIAVILRLVPTSLQPWVVWLIPAKWHLEHDIVKMAEFAVPGLEQRKADSNPEPALTSLSWMLDKAKTDQEANPYFLAKLQSALNAGGVHPTAILIVNTLLDLAKYPEYQEMIREEIQQTHIKCGGRWSQDDYDTLYKLDSALKETLRFNPATLTAYSRELLMDVELSSGLRLRKGQLICVPNSSLQQDGKNFPAPKVYDALRSYKDFEAHRARPFKSLDEHAHRWGAGRSACPGRFMANVIVKVILVKLINEFDFQLSPAHGRPESTTAHEFIWIDLDVKIMIKRRAVVSDIGY